MHEQKNWSEPSSTKQAKQKNLNEMINNKHATPLAKRNIKQNNVETKQPLPYENP